MVDHNLVERLREIGVQIKEQHFTGDSSYPTEYTLRYSFVSAVGPTFGLALVEFIEKLIAQVPVEKALEQAKPPTAYLDDDTRVEPGWLGETYDENAQKIVEYNREMDERNRIIRENVEKPCLPLHDGE